MERAYFCACARHGTDRLDTTMLVGGTATTVLIGGRYEGRKFEFVLTAAKARDFLLEVQTRVAELRD